LSTDFRIFYGTFLHENFVKQRTSQRREFLRRIDCRPERRVLLCTLCGGEIGKGEDYWYLNGESICGSCLEEFARIELAPYRRTRGREENL